MEILIHFEGHFDIMFLLARYLNFHGHIEPLYSSSRIYHLMICAQKSGNYVFLIQNRSRHYITTAAL